LLLGVGSGGEDVRKLGRIVRFGDDGRTTSAVPAPTLGS
jgi:hypothetical protein